jgi:hypothetical protein
MIREGQVSSQIGAHSEGVPKLMEAAGLPAAHRSQIASHRTSDPPSGTQLEIRGTDEPPA